jgi:hypothetical protein
MFCKEYGYTGKSGFIQVLLLCFYNISLLSDLPAAPAKLDKRIGTADRGQKKTAAGTHSHQ